MSPFPLGLSLGQCATLACLWEASSPKPGNVHRGADFADATFYDFVTSAAAIGPVFDQSDRLGVGELALQSVQATRRLVATNTNLGTILLLAPLARVPRAIPLAEGISEVLAKLTSRDAALVYEAIRLANPGGLGDSRAMDIANEAPADLIAAMRFAAERDAIARQYAVDFADILTGVAPLLAEEIETCNSVARGVVRAQIRILATTPDTLIARKRGQETAAQVSLLAQRVLEAGAHDSDHYQEALADFDFYLRCDGHNRNPGATADWIAAGLFVLLREGRISAPIRW